MLYEVTITREIEAESPDEAAALAHSGKGVAIASDVIEVPACPHCGKHWPKTVLVEARAESGEMHTEVRCSDCATR